MKRHKIIEYKNIKYLVSLGLSMAEVSRKTCINYSTVRRRIKKMGLIVKRIRITSPHRLIRSTKIYREWRDYILNQFNHTCSLCGSKERLELDHIEPVSKRPDLVMDENNARILCSPCHRKTPSYPINLAAYYNKINDIQASTT